MLKSIPSNPNYLVSDKGIIFRKTVNEELKPLKPNYHLAYATVQLGRRTEYVHRLVAEAFVSHRPEQTDVFHIDGDLTNNAASNLLWVTPSQAQIYSSWLVEYRKSYFKPMISY